MIGVGTFKITDRAREYVNKVLNSERLSYGYFTQKFERVFAAAHQCRFGIMTNSGTSSLQIALGALKQKYGWQDGDEVICPAVTFIATSNIILQNNMKPVLVDVDPVYYSLDPSKVEAAITPRTRAMIPVHLFGQPCDMGPLMDIAKKHGLRVIEDSCETMFAKHNGQSVGSFGDVGCFSTYIAHLLTTGVGGLCTTNDPELAVALRSMMNHGRDSIYISMDDSQGKSKEEMELVIQRRFKFVQMGYSYRVTEMEGALGLAEFEDHQAMIQKRRENGTFFTEKLKHLESRLQLPKIRTGSEHSYMMFPIVLRLENKRELVNYLEQNGIETRDMLPLTNQPFYQQLLGIKESDFPIAQWINNNGFYIACHQNLTTEEKQYIVDVFDSYFKQSTLRKEQTALILMSKDTGESAQMMYESLAPMAFDERFFVEAGHDPQSQKFFKEKGFTVIQSQSGKGGSLMQALDSCSAEQVIVMGTDGCDNPEDIPRLMVQLKQGQDLVIASRLMPGGHRSANRRFSLGSIGNRLFSLFTSTLFDENITDVNNIFRGFRKSALQKLNLKESGEAIMFEMSMRMLQEGYRVAESPTHERTAIKSSHPRNRLTTGLRFLWIMFKVITGQRKLSLKARRKQLLETPPMVAHPMDSQKQDGKKAS